MFLCLKMVQPKGFEPLASRLSVVCSTVELRLLGARNRTRTCIASQPRDFKSLVSTVFHHARKEIPTIQGGQGPWGNLTPYGAGYPVDEGVWGVARQPDVVTQTCNRYK